MRLKKQRSIIAKINSIYAHLIGYAQSAIYAIKYRKLLKNADKNSYMPSKDEIKAYKKRWSGLGYWVDPIYYKIFSNYVKPDIDFVPEDISHNVVETLLDPPLYRGFYSDKNMFDKVLADIHNACPKTLFRRIGGFYYNANYQNILGVNDNMLNQYLMGYSRIIVKPTIDTSSGIGIHFYELRGGKWVDVQNGELLSLLKLDRELGCDYIVQEAMRQSVFMQQFNPTSVNTLRLFTYRSVKDNQVHVLNAIMRIGRNGSLVDNAHQGGATIGINIETGELNHFMVDQDAKFFTKFNGIDFEKESFVIPAWEQIKEFAKRIGEANIYHRCLNMDIMIDDKGRPRFIEYNLTQMSVWLFQFNNGSCYGKYTDEVIGYCREHKHDVKSEYLLL